MPVGASNRVAEGENGQVPELPEVAALAGFLRERLVGRVVARVDVAGIAALKTYDPPVTSLGGLSVTDVRRRGQFLDIDVDGLHLVVHLARAGWVRWREELPTTPLKPGKGPIVLRVQKATRTIGPALASHVLVSVLPSKRPRPAR